MGLVCTPARFKIIIRHFETRIQLVEYILPTGCHFHGHQVLLTAVRISRKEAFALVQFGGLNTLLF